MPQSGGVSVSRLLLRRLRDVMAGGGSAQDRLAKIVTLIAGELVTEVCSAYIMRPGEVLELFATKGLKAEAVHKTRLRVGEGLLKLGSEFVEAHLLPIRVACLTRRWGAQKRFQAPCPARGRRAWESGGTPRLERIFRRAA